MKKLAISFKKNSVLGVFITFVLLFFHINTFAQSCGDLLKNNAITDTIYTNKILARTFWVSSKNKVIIPHFIYSGRSYYIKLAKNNPDDRVKLKVMIRFNSGLESIWDNVSSNTDYLTLSLSNTQRVVFEISLEETESANNASQPVCVGLLINSHNYEASLLSKNNLDTLALPSGPPSDPE